MVNKPIKCWMDREFVRMEWSGTPFFSPPSREMYAQFFPLETEEDEERYLWHCEKAKGRSAEAAREMNRCLLEDMEENNEN